MTYLFDSHIFKNENELVKALISSLPWNDALAQKNCKQAVSLVNAVRSAKSRGSQLESFLKEFSLNTEEGIAMMSLAEALLRIPDSYTANLLIRDKVVAVNWLQNQGDSQTWMTKAAGMGLALTRRTLDSAFSKLGEPVIREAMARAMQVMGKQFVLGTTISDAISNAQSWKSKNHTISYDMLGEGARERETAHNYYNSYSDAIDAIGSANEGTGRDVYERCGISVKLSALHPRYIYAQKQFCVPELTEQILSLCIKAKHYDMPLTIDAEETGRLCMSIEVFEALLSAPELEGWDGLGLAVQAYQKRAVPLIEYIADSAKSAGRKIHIRLVKGAYWDSEIKRAQMLGLQDYPVFTRKLNTDLSYLVCAHKMFENHDVIYPMLATHNAHSIVAISNMARGRRFEFQRLHGMGEALYAQFKGQSDVPVRVYAPVGAHGDLLPYLVRRLLENGANSSFVNQLLDHKVQAEDLVRDPVSAVKLHKGHHHPEIPLPRDIFCGERANSVGFDLEHAGHVLPLARYIKENKKLKIGRSLINGQYQDAIHEDEIDGIYEGAHTAFLDWNARPVAERAGCLERFADLLEENRKELYAILVHEAGKTYQDAIDEVREAIDFARYYAVQGRYAYAAEGVVMPGYTGERNILRMQGRGVFLCISPWNFPLAIFVGQILAALVAGNAVIAKPATQTRLIAMRGAQLMHEAGIPKEALQLICEGGRFGAMLAAHKSVSGVVFTGSTGTAKSIQMSLAKDNPAIVPFIAETGGQNAMIADSSALLERLVDDVIHSAFLSAGQRCSALRVLYIQDDVADSFIDMLKGAMAELRVGNPEDISVDIGYIIDKQSKNKLDEHVSYVEKVGELIATAPVLERHDRLFAPCAYEIAHIDVLKEEVFGPVLHVIRYKGSQLGQVLSQINSSGYGLTCGLHSRISSQHEQIIKHINAGNIYVNRNMTGAIVGVQPFGGMGLSGTGPKAGGPHYVYAFGVEKHVCSDITAIGGNTALVSLGD